MKVKCKSKRDGRYFWVIVGPGGHVITFERDVVWNAAGSMRQTEMWLHDLWLVHRGVRRPRRSRKTGAKPAPATTREE